MAAFLTVAHPFVSALLAEDLDDRGLTWLRESHPKAVAQVAVISPKAATTVARHPRVRIVSARARPAMTPDPSLYVTGEDGATWAQFDTRGNLRTGCFRPSRTSDAPER